jgi:hypothetical protein
MPKIERETPVFPMCKLAEYTVTAGSVRRRSLVRTQIRQTLADPEKRRWWHVEAKTEIRKFFRSPAGSRHDLTKAANRLRDMAAGEDRKSKKDTLLASARALEAFAPIAEASRNKGVVVSPGKRDGAHIRRGSVKIIVSPDLLFLERGSEHVVGALKLHASQEFKLTSDALINAAAILFSYLEEHGEKPVKEHCTVVDLFTPAFESAPAGMKKRMQAVDAACEEIDGWWNAMFDRIKAEVEAKRKRMR